jgi:hypothetical protein
MGKWAPQKLFHFYYPNCLPEIFVPPKRLHSILTSYMTQPTVEEERPLTGYVICGLDPALLHSGGSIGLEFQVYNFLNKRVFFFLFK